MTDCYAFVLRQTGGPEVLEAEPISLPRPGPDEVRVRNEAVGLNFIDTYHRSGLYKLSLPSGLGGEGRGWWRPSASASAALAKTKGSAISRGRSAPMPAIARSPPTGW